jgi:hypothetical protein
MATELITYADIAGMNNYMLYLERFPERIEFSKLPSILSLPRITANISNRPLITSPARRTNTKPSGPSR